MDANTNRSVFYPYKHIVDIDSPVSMKKTVREEKKKFQTSKTSEDWSNLVLDIEQRMKKMIRGEGEEGRLHDSARDVCEKVLKQIHDAKMKMLPQ